MNVGFASEHALNADDLPAAHFARYVPQRAYFFVII